MTRGPKHVLPPPFLKRVWIDPERMQDTSRYPLALPLFRRGDFEFAFERPITIFVGENGAGKTTLLEAIAMMAGFDRAGGGNGYRPVDHSGAREQSAGTLANALRAAWLPKITSGWFFKAETFFSVARYLDEAARDIGSIGPDFLSYSHGEGFLRFFEERCRTRGVYILDEPEAALSPRRQAEFLRLLRKIQEDGVAQIIIATHSPILMACPDADLYAVGLRGIDRTTVEATDHFRLYREFCSSPRAFAQDWIDGSV